MSLADQVVRKAFAAIKRVGAQGQVVTETGGVYDPNTGKHTGSTAASVTVWMSPPVEFREFYGSIETQVKQGSSVVVLPTQAGLTELKIGHQIVLGGKIWNVVAVRTHTLQSTVCAYEAEVSLG